MSKKIAVVTGAGRGIGSAIARELGKKGFIVGIHYNSSVDSAKKLQSEIEDSFLIQADISTIEGCDVIYSTVKDRPEPLEVLVNNAGFVKDNPLFQASVDEFDAMVALNMKATWYLTKRLMRLMIRNGSGRIINISSIIGSQGNPTQSVYGMTKAAIDNFTKVAAMEMADRNILVNSVAPGFIETDMTKDLSDEHKAAIIERIPLKRIGKPEEIADVVGFLATSGSYITGTVIHVNGGMYGG
ncbi:MAG: SDR family oxidoreductase [Leptonema sp. (in: Bacteria)]|nr:SDR family oxidoreductase [Leptonema sp. (in: bacteria)]